METVTVAKFDTELSKASAEPKVRDMAAYNAADALVRRCQMTLARQQEALRKTELQLDAAIRLRDAV